MSWRFDRYGNLYRWYWWLFHWSDFITMEQKRERWLVFCGFVFCNIGQYVYQGRRSAA